MSLLTGGIQGFPSGGTSQVYTTPYPLKPGTRARDVAGNEYVFCDFTAAGAGGGNPYGILVYILDDFTAIPFASTAGRTGAVGVVCGSRPTTDNGGWVQIYGLHTGMQIQNASDTSTSLTVFVGQTSVCTPSGVPVATTETSESEGMHIIGLMTALNNLGDRVTDSSGPVTNTSVGPDSAAETSGTTWLFLNTISVWLNYPYVDGQAWEPVS